MHGDDVEVIAGQGTIGKLINEPEFYKNAKLTLQKVDKAAQAAGTTPKEFTDKISGSFKELWKTLNISYDDFIQFKGESGAKEAGKMRAEGKEYVVKDGDVLNFLFNV